MNKTQALITGIRLGAGLMYLLEQYTRNRRRDRSLNRQTAALAFVGGAGAGAAAMYLLDPDRGRRRRKLINDQLVRVWSRSDDVIGKTARDLRNRARGLLIEAQARLGGEEVSDEVLVARVRAKLGRVVSHPSAIEVTANQGRVTLRGPILAHEVHDLLAAVAAVRGVTEVDNQLKVHKQADGVPGLQGGGRRPGERFELLQENWSPTARLLASLAGGALAAYGAIRRGFPGAALGTLGLGLLARGLTNIELKRLVGLGGGRRAVDVQKTISINAPVDQVFALWSNYANFPRFMSNLREVRDLGDGRSHWVAQGPAGVPVEWDAVITRYEPNKVLAWKSVPGALVANAGIIRFEPTPGGGTRVDIKLSYNPPAGALGHAVALLFGADPKSEMDEDLVRFKSLIEEGKAMAHHRTVTREEREAPDLRAREHGAGEPQR
jgi:uncharacterized membrane protein